MRIIVKSSPENWEKEKNGKKPNTVRELDGRDLIEVVNVDTGEKFIRCITDVTVFNGRIIISWRHEE